MDDFFRRMFGLPQDPWGRPGGHPLRREDDWSYNNEEPRDFFDNGLGGRQPGMGGFGPFGGFPFGGFGPSPFGELGNHVDDMFTMVGKQFEDMSRSMGHMAPPPLQGPQGYDNRSSARDRMLKHPEYHHQDQDLDNRFSGNYEGRPTDDRALVPVTPNRHHEQPQLPTGGVWGSSMSFTRIQGADGKLEERRTTQDSRGNQSTTVTRHLGDQTYSTTVKSDQEGVKEEIEEFNNMGEGDLDEFRQKWDSNSRRGRLGPPPASRDPPGNELVLRRPPNYDPSYDDLFRRYYGS